MAIVLSADVFCDGEFDNVICGKWTGGIVSASVDITIPKLRGAARRVAWAEKQWVHVKGKDYCPSCYQKLKDKHGTPTT